MKKRTARATVVTTRMTRLLMGIACTIASVAQASDPLDPWANPTSFPQDLVSSNGFVYFTADDGIHGRELWRTDGTEEGTLLVDDLSPGPAGSEFKAFATCGPYLYFSALHLGSHGDVLLRAGGSPPRVEPLLSDAQQPLRVSTIMVRSPFAVINETLYTTSGHGEFPWVYAIKGDALTATAVPMPTLKYPIFHVGELHAGKTVLYVVAAYNLAVSGTKSESVLFRITPGSWRIETVELGVDYNLHVYGVLEDTLIFRGRRVPDALGDEPYVWRVNEPAPQPVKDIAPGPSSSLGQDNGCGFIGNNMFFTATDDVYSWEPWITDGSEAGTRLVRDIHGGRESSFPGMFTATREQVFFQAQNRETGIELWVSDGTSDGTRLTRDIVPGPESSRPYRPVAAGSRVFFTAHHLKSGEELWVSDGTESGTRLVKDIVPGAGSSEPFLKAALGERIVFTADDHVHGAEVWVSDGTEAGTFMVKDIAPARGPNPSSDPQHLTLVGDILFFVVNDARHGAELWRSDGTDPGTVLVKDIFSGRASSNPSELCACNGYLFFQAEDPEHGVELWVSDGTSDGTQILLDCIPGPESGNPHALICTPQAELFFAAGHPDAGVEPWRLDVSASLKPINAGPIDLNPGKAGSDPRDFTAGQLPDGLPCVYFTANDGKHGRELFVYANGRVYQVSDIITNVPAGSEPSNLTPSGSTLFFNATAPARGAELFKTQGAPETTTIVRDVRRE